MRDAIAGRFTVDRVGSHEVLYRTDPTTVYFTRDWTGLAKFSWVYCEEHPTEP